jgi:type IV pilus assembly protein PilA
MKRSNGFTLIELMIVIAIVAILSSIAITVYNDSIAKAQLSEAFTVADSLKTPITESFTQTGACPGNGVDGIMADGSYVGKYVATADTAGAAATGCTITVTFKSSTGVSNGLRGQAVLFTGTNNGGAFAWACSSAIAAKYKPQTCQ